MTIMLSNGERTVDIGSGAVLFSVLSTVKIKLNSILDSVPHALHFLESGECIFEDALITAREINLIRDQLSCLSPNDAVYDMNNLSVKAPWKNNISPVVTSCANLYTTADGKDLLFEIVNLLVYSSTTFQNVIVAG